MYLNLRDAMFESKKHINIQRPTGSIAHLSNNVRL